MKDFLSSQNSILFKGPRHVTKQHNMESEDLAENETRGGFVLIRGPMLNHESTGPRPLPLHQVLYRIFNFPREDHIAFTCVRVFLSVLFLFFIIIRTLKIIVDATHRTKITHNVRTPTDTITALMVFL